MLPQRGNMVPNFTLQDATGTPVRRSAFRGKQHLALVFMPDATNDAAQGYLQALTACFADIRASAATVLAVTRNDRSTLAAVHTALALPFALLSDPDGAATGRFLPAAATFGTAVLDRYGELYYGVAVTTIHELPPPSELVEWLAAVDNQCSI